MLEYAGIAHAGIVATVAFLFGRHMIEPIIPNSARFPHVLPWPRVEDPFAPSHEGLWCSAIQIS
jgi:hypothetical protein